MNCQTTRPFMYQLILLCILGVCINTVLSNANEAAYSTSNAFPTPVSQALHNFAFEMFRKISESSSTEGNLIFSPISVYSAFSALLPGLSGTSLEEVESLLRAEHLTNLTLEESNMSNAIFNVTIPRYAIQQTQRLFIDKRVRLRKAFKSLTEGYQRALIKKLDFQLSPEVSRKKINRYVAKETKRDVPNLLEDDSIDGSTKLVLVNTVYLEAPWKYPFPQSSTLLDYFNLSNNERIHIPFMFNTEGKCGKPQHVNELQSNVFIFPFDGDILSMIVFMPDTAGDFEAFEQPGASIYVQDVLDTMWRRSYPSTYSCRILMPKFAINFKVEDMKLVLNSMGVRDIFDEGAADFSRMTSSDNLYVTDVQHAAAIRVTENGVKASAAAAITSGWKSAPFTINLTKPFIFMIRHASTGSILYLGKLNRPTIQE